MPQVRDKQSYCFSTSNLLTFSSGPYAIEALYTEQTLDVCCAIFRENASTQISTKHFQEKFLSII